MNVHFVQFFENYIKSPNFWATFSHRNSYLCLNFDKKWVGLHFGRFFNILTYPVTLIRRQNEGSC
jgi:hypothetical protein